MHHKKRVRSAFLITILFILFLIILTSAFLDKYIKQKLENAVRENTNGEYNLTINSVNSHIWNFSVTVNGVYFYSVKNNRNYFKVEQFSMDRLGLRELFFKNKINVGEILFQNPEISFVTLKDATKKEKFHLYDLISGKYDSFYSGEIKIENLKLHLYNHENDKAPYIGIENGSAVLENFKVDSAINYTEEKLFDAESGEASIHQLAITLADSFYTAIFPYSELSYKDRSLKIDSFQMHPDYSKMEFGRKTGHQTDRIDVLISEFHISNGDIKSFVEQGNVLVHSLECRNTTVNVFRDKGIKPMHKRKAFIQELLQDFPHNIRIDSLFIKNGNVTYEEKQPEIPEAGILQFKNISANVSKISNRLPDDTLFLRATGKLYGQSTVHVRVNIPYKTLCFNSAGEISAIPMEILNSTLVSSTHIYATSGQLDSLGFSFHADTIMARGKLTFAYHDLKIASGNKKADTTSMKQKITSVIANNFVIKKSNPEKKAALRTVDLDYPRDPEKFITNYSWKTILSGIKKTIGVPDPNKE